MITKPGLNSRFSVFLFLICLSVTCRAQDSLTGKREYLSIKPGYTFQLSEKKIQDRKAFQRSLIIPTTLTAYGFIALNIKDLRSVDWAVKEEVWTEHPHNPRHFDDVLQYVPAISVYGLHAIGIKGKNTLWDATRLYLLSSLFMAITVQSIKHISRRPRPDGFGHNAFPSGHTSTAFVAAEFLNQEYKSRSPWYGIAGYAMAGVVGYMRLYNNRHWFNDIITGAGIGMAITKLTYWFYPAIKRMLEHKKTISAY